MNNVKEVVYETRSGNRTNTVQGNVQGHSLGNNEGKAWKAKKKYGRTEVLQAISCCLGTYRENNIFCEANTLPGRYLIALSYKCLWKGKN